MLAMLCNRFFENMETFSNSFKNLKLLVLFFRILCFLTGSLEPLSSRDAWGYSQILVCKSINVNSLLFLD